MMALLCQNFIVRRFKTLSPDLLYLYANVSSGINLYVVMTDYQGSAVNKATEV